MMSFFRGELSSSDEDSDLLDAIMEQQCIDLMKKREEAVEEPGEEVKVTLRWKRGSTGPSYEAGTESSEAAPSPGPSQAMTQPTADTLYIPDEVLENIFSYLGQDDILRRVLPVCEQWQAVAQSRVLGKHLVFCDNDDIPAEEALRLIQSAPNLQSVQLLSRPDTAELLQALGHRCTDLRRLVVTFCEDKHGSLTAALLTVFRSSKQLTDLTLRSVDVASPLQFCMELGTVLRSLRRLTIDCRWFGHAELDAALGSCHLLQEFRAFYRPWSDANVTKLVQLWGSSLQVLGLRALELSDAGLAALAGCSHLQALELLRMRSPGAALQKLAVLPRLESFELEFSGRVLSENIQLFFRQSRSADRLRKIRLYHCFKVDDSVLTTLAFVCPRLEELDVSHCRGVTAVGVREVVRNCRCLLWLRVYRTGVSVAQVLPQLPQLAPQLRQLWIGNSQMGSLGESVLQHVQAEMPHLKIVACS